MHLDKHLLVLSAIIFCVASSHFLDDEWNAWKSKYDKKYVAPDEELFRRKVWEDTWHKVQKHNELAGNSPTTYRKAVNKFADMTWEEHRSRNCISATRPPSMLANIPVEVKEKNFDIPKKVDWRESNCVAPAKNQGEFCGSCWAFATVGIIESHNCIKNGELVILSEQQLVDCDGKNEGCCGGLPAYALDYVAKHGVMPAKDYEYSQKKFTCLYKQDEALSFNVSKYYILPEEDTMASSLAFDGPITIGIDASQDFMQYSDGIFKGECSEEANHAIIIVGYGTEHDEEEDEDVDYWIIKNSWGKDWGENGFAKMMRNVNLCGITSMAASVDFS